MLYINSIFINHAWFYAHVNAMLTFLDKTSHRLLILPDADVDADDSILLAELF